MKLLVVCSSLFLFASCGVVEKLNKECGKDLRVGCDPIFGKNDVSQDKVISELENKNREQDDRILRLEESTNSIIASIEDLTKNIDELENSESLTTQTIATLQAIASANTVQLLSLTSEITILQGNLGGLSGDLIQLTSSLSKTIVDFKNPCGDGAGYDEILMKTKDGKYIGYFEDGGKRFLSILDAGSYVTTDQSRCYFTINNGNIINEHY